MDKPYFTQTTIEKASTLPRGDYDECVFDTCQLSDADLSGMHFSSCQFRNCNLSMMRVTDTAFRDTAFTGCKLLGVHFEQVNPFGFGVSFVNCILDLSSFFDRKMKNTQFKDCSMQDVDFGSADLTQAVFDNCNLARAVFDNTNLEKADLSTAYNYSIDPTRNKIRKARFSMPALAGLLDQYDIEIL